MSGLTTSTKRIARFGLHQCGALDAYVWSSRRRFRIVTYHRFSPSMYPRSHEDLARQCAYLKQRYEVVSLSEIAASLRTGKALPPGALAITIDDGYRDFLVDAVPVLRRLQIPATIYLMTDFVDGKVWPWWDQVSYAARQAPAGIVKLPLGANGAEEEFRLDSEDRRETAATEIRLRLTRIPNRKRTQFVERMAELFRVDIPVSPPEDCEGLNWDEVRLLAHHGIEIGAHTKSHPVLTNLEDPDQLKEEIAGSLKRIEQELGRAPAHFCYPNGGFHDDAVRVVERCGFETAVTTVAGLNRTSENRFLLKRLSAAPDLNEDYFREHIAGLHAA